mmetsp:Transcript_43056/g.133857  ORF Transcript_43056/g.133857 Transcript_43056/m.133857 type:complete len:364 (-) Transcript_43056:64-1155(-)
MPPQSSEDASAMPSEVPESLLPFASKLFQRFPAVLLALGHPSLAKDFELPPAPSSCTLIEESGGYKRIQVVLRRRGASKKCVPPYSLLQPIAPYGDEAGGLAHHAGDAGLSIPPPRVSNSSTSTSFASQPRSGASQPRAAAACGPTPQPREAQLAVSAVPPARNSQSSTSTSFASQPRSMGSQPRLKGMFRAPAAGGQEAGQASAQNTDTQYAAAAPAAAPPVPAPPPPARVPAQVPYSAPAPPTRAPAQAQGPPPGPPPAAHEQHSWPPAWPRGSGTAAAWAEEAPELTTEEAAPLPQAEVGGASHGAKQPQPTAKSPRRRRAGAKTFLGSLKEDADEPQSPRSPGSYQPWGARAAPRFATQ